MPLISVIVPTNRVGGLDLLCAGLAQQTMHDFELILVDHLHPWRAEEVSERLKALPFTVKHIRPIDDPFPNQAYQRAVNTGLAYADGKIAYFTCDYAFLPPTCLAEHAAFHAETQAPRALIGTFRLIETPPIHPRFPIGRYGAGTVLAHRQLWESVHARMSACSRWIVSYLQDLNDDCLQPFMWSAFAEDFAADGKIDGLGIIHEEPKISHPEGPTNHAVCHLKNDSFPLERMLSINGFDEEFDGGHAYQDSEMARRLERIGLAFFLKPRLTVGITDMHHHMTIRKISRAETANHAIFERKQNGPNAITLANTDDPKRNLKRIRQDIRTSQ